MPLPPLWRSAEMHHPIRHDFAGAGKIVDKDHRKHHQAAQSVDGHHARGRDIRLGLGVQWLK